MKEDIMQRLTVTLNALNSVSVSGKANLSVKFCCHHAKRGCDRQE